MQPGEGCMKHILSPDFPCTDMVSFVFEDIFTSNAKMVRSLTKQQICCVCFYFVTWHIVDWNHLTFKSCVNKSAFETL